VLGEADKVVEGSERRMFPGGELRDRQEGTTMIDWKQLQRYQTAMTPWQWALSIVVVSLAIWLIVWLRSYFREDTDDADETLEMLTQFRDLHQEGGLSDDEFRLIRSRLTHIAQKALVADRTRPDGGHVEPGETSLTISDKEDVNVSPAQHALAEQEEKSERISDEKTG
jgi:hypothetical protein